MRVPLPIKWHGGKYYLASKIVALMPPHTHYVEPFFGGGAVLLAKDPDGVSEVVNDIDRDLTNFWTVLQNGPLFYLFRRLVEATPFSEAEWKHAAESLKQSCEANGYDHAGGNDCVRAAWFFVACRQSLAGRRDAFTAVTKTRVRRRMNNEVSAWLTAVEGLPAVHARLKRVLVLDARDALDVIRSQDGPDTLFYLDPPYLPETRAAAEVYAHEMTVDQHSKLLFAINECRGKVMISGYRSNMYDYLLHETKGWSRHDFDLPNQAAGGKTKRRMTECVWCNF